MRYLQLRYTHLGYKQHMPGPQFLLLHLHTKMNRLHRMFHL